MLATLPPELLKMGTGEEKDVKDVDESTVEIDDNDLEKVRDKDEDSSLKTGMRRKIGLRLRFKGTKVIC